MLAILRGVTEGLLNAGLYLDELSELKRQFVHNRQFEFFDDLIECAEDCNKRLLLPATESAIFSQLKERADEEAIKVFGRNLHDLLMAHLPDRV